MIRAIVWKESREQGLIALTLLLVGGALLAATAAFADPPVSGARPGNVLQYLGVGRLATLMLAVTAGIVSGGALFAAEREARTMTFLESLPGLRWQLWQAKLIAGVGLTVIQITAVLLLSAALGLVTELPWMQSIAAESLLAFAWGTFGSTFARTTLGSVGFAIPFATAAAFIYMMPILLMFGSSGGLPRGFGTTLFFLLMLATPLVASALAFSRVDRIRQATAARERIAAQNEGLLTPVRATKPAKRRRSTPASLALLWMVSRQLALPTAALSAFATVFGISLLAPGIQAVFYWPMLALTAGVIAGVLTFGIEQTRGEYRFWAEARLPLLRLWLMKLTLHLLLLAWLLLLLALPSILRAAFLGTESTSRGRTFLATAFHTRVFDELRSKTWLYLLLPAVYGFASGHLFSLLFRKAVVAAGVAGLVGGSLVLFWIPSLLAGGVEAWQVWLPAVSLVLLGGMLLHAWTLERLLHRRSLIRLGLGCGVALLLTSIGLAYRVYEVPLAENAEADREFIARLPETQARTSGREFQSALASFLRANARVTGVTQMGSRREHPVVEENSPEPRVIGWTGFESLEVFLIQDWAAKREGTSSRVSTTFDCAAWLDGLFDPSFRGRDMDWIQDASHAVNAPPGAFWDPRLVTARTGVTTLNESRAMAAALLLRGLQQQSLGVHASFPEQLEIVLAMVRAMRSGSVVPSFLMSTRIERMAAVATQRWLRRFQGTPETLGKVRDHWQALEASSVDDPRTCFLVERYVLREAMSAPSTWLEDRLLFSGESPESIESVINLIATAWSAPWERERTRRLLSREYANGQSPETAYLRGRPGANLFYLRRATPEHLLELDRRSQAARRLLILTVSLAMFEATTGRPVESLDELVQQRFVSEVPRDPYAEGQPLRYRLASGESLVIYSTRSRRSEEETRPWSGSETTPTLAISRGQGIVWSVGPGKINQEGRRMLGTTDPAALEEDSLLLVVPRLSKTP